MKIISGTIVFVVKDGKVLLAKKTRVLGIGKWNGYGGARLQNKDSKQWLETTRQCAVREFKEESGGAEIKEEFLKKMGCIIFHNIGKFRFLATVYIANDIIGEPSDSDEMVNPTSFPLNGLPSADKFMEGDVHWLPDLVNGEQLSGCIEYDIDFHLKKHEINSVAFS